VSGIHGLLPKAKIYKKDFENNNNKATFFADEK
jgi:hypothetical protein